MINSPNTIDSLCKVIEEMGKIVQNQVVAECATLYKCGIISNEQYITLLSQDTKIIIVYPKENKSFDWMKDLNKLHCVSRAECTGGIDMPYSMIVRPLNTFIDIWRMINDKN